MQCKRDTWIMLFSLMVTQGNKLKSKMKEGWMTNDEGWLKNDEGWWFQALEGFCCKTDWQTNEQMHEQTFAIVVDFMTEN